jgi:hypothetical protein
MPDAPPHRFPQPKHCGDPAGDGVGIVDRCDRPLRFRIRTHRLNEIPCAGGGLSGQDDGRMVGK